MLKVTFVKTTGGIFWVECESMEFDPLDGYRMEGAKEDSYKRGPCTACVAPAEWKLVKAEEV